MANLTVDELTFQDPNAPPDVGPKLSCSAADQLSLRTGNLRLEDGKEVFFSDNGQLRCGDNHRRIVFNGSPRQMEVYQEGDIIFFTGNADAEQMRVLGNGASGVGIGTAAPQAKLQVSGGAIMPAIGNNSQSGIQFPSGATGDEAFIRYFPVTGERAKLQIGIGNEADDSLGLVQAGAERLTITNGRVGIGTAAPNRGLHVEPSEIHSGGAGAGYSFGNRETTGFVESPAAGERWVWYSLSGAARLWSGGDKLTITPEGNVGIGTATPEGKLDVKGEIRAGNSDLYFTRTDHNHTGIGNTEGFAAIENAANFNALMILGRSGTPQGRAVRLWDFLEVNGALNVTGNVGIGTAAPSRMLHVEPSEIHSGGFSGGFSFGDRLVAGFVESPGSGERWVWYSFGGTARLWSGWDKMAVTPAGNVGIGTTAPAYKLDVVADNAIKLGLEGNGGGRLILANNANDNRIYIEAFSSDGLGHASELLLTGRNSAPLPQITLRAGTTFISGRLTKSSGAFKIDHPLDPENKYLYHSFVESPDMMNIYNGNVITDRHGEATVTLPAYFEALNRDFRYQLTVIGRFAQVIIASKIRNRRFTIKADQPHVEVSWQVTGIRRDAYANANRIEVEEDKPSSERGSLLHPEAFGRAPSEEV